MRIKSIYFTKESIFGDIKLDFQKDGVVCKKIIIIGENGVGKTNFLKKIYAFLNGKDGEGIRKIEYLNDNGEDLYLDNVGKKGTFDYYYKGKMYKYELIDTLDSKNLKRDINDLRHNGVIFSTAQIDFKTNKIKNVSSMDINVEEKESVENYNFTAIKQLLVDLEASDAEKYTSMNKKGEKISYDEFKVKYSKISIFSDAFSSFFEELKYIGLETTNGEKEIFFEKNGTRVTIDNLSTGEKQIVFRGVYLLKNIELNKNGFVLIDEPELSMHPVWEDKLYEYYSNILFNSKCMVGQLIIATHSERLLDCALHDSDCLVIEIKKENGNPLAIKHNSNFILPYISEAEINYKIFKIYSIDFFIQLFDNIMYLSNNTTVLGADDFIFNHSHYNHSFDYATSYRNITYKTLPTALRNYLHHGQVSNVSKTDLRKCIDFLYDICKYEANIS